MMSVPVGRPAGSAIDAELAHARTLLRAHAAPLFAIASLLLAGDDDAAAQVVVDVIADATPNTLTNGGVPDLRALLASAVYVRCLDMLSSRDRPPGPPSPAQGFGAATVLARLSLRHRAVVSLVLIGGQDLGLAATTLGVSHQTVVSDLLGAIASIHADNARTPLAGPSNPDLESA